MTTHHSNSLDGIFGSVEGLKNSRIEGEGPARQATPDRRDAAERTQRQFVRLDAQRGHGWNPDEVNRPAYLILSTLGGLRGENGQPLALGYHTGHWELGLLVKEAAEVAST